MRFAALAAPRSHQRSLLFGPWPVSLHLPCPAALVLLLINWNMTGTVSARQSGQPEKPGNSSLNRSVFSNLTTANASPAHRVSEDAVLLATSGEADSSFSQVAPEVQVPPPPSLVEEEEDEEASAPPSLKQRRQLDHRRKNRHGRSVQLGLLDQGSASLVNLEWASVKADGQVQDARHADAAGEAEEDEETSEDEEEDDEGKEQQIEEAHDGKATRISSEMGIDVPKEAKVIFGSCLAALTVLGGVALFYCCPGNSESDD